MYTLRALARLASIILIPLTFATFVTAAGWAPMALDVTDAMLVFLALAAVLRFAPRLYDTLTAPDPMQAQDFASLGLNDMFLYMLLAGLWSVRASSGHAGSIQGVEVGLRLAFRVFAVRSLIYIIAAQGAEGTDRVPPTRWLSIFAIVMMAVMALAAIDVAGVQIPAIRIPRTMQDDAPTPMETYSGR